jgi:spermidine synthase
MAPPDAADRAADPSADLPADPTADLPADPPVTPVTSSAPAALGPVLAGALVFGTSAAVLVLEVLSLRLLAPYLGLTLQTSTAVIGIALSAIACGAWVGGRAADRTVPERAVGPLVLVGGALYLLVVPLVRWAGDSVRGTPGAGIVLPVAALAVFAPAALLSAVSPMVVKARLATLEQTGAVVGRLSGLGTLGAIVGTFVTGFVLVAAFPTSAVVLAVGSLLVAAGVALTLRARSGRRLAGPLTVAGVAAACTALAPSGCQVETAYHCARVAADAARPSGRVLVLDTLRHSYVDLHDPQHLEFTYVRAMASALDAVTPTPRPVDALFLGGGGFTLPRFLAASRPGSHSLVHEIDPDVVALARQRLGLRTRPGDGVEARIGDARLGVFAAPPDSWDVVVGDAFGQISVPWHLTTREVVQQVRRVLRPGGVYLVNVIDHPPLAFARAEVTTIADVFGSVAVLATPDTLAGRGGGNLVLVASTATLPVDAVRAALARRAPTLAVAAGAAARAFAAGAGPLTDDHAPVDQLLTPYGS